MKQQSLLAWVKKTCAPCVAMMVMGIALSLIWLVYFLPLLLRNNL